MFLRHYSNNESKKFQCPAQFIIDLELDVSFYKYDNYGIPLIFKCPEGSSGKTIEVDIQETHQVSMFEIDALVNDLGFYYIQGHAPASNDYAGDKNSYKIATYKLVNARFLDENYLADPIGYADNAIDNIFPDDTQ